MTPWTPGSSRLAAAPSVFAALNRLPDDDEARVQVQGELFGGGGAQATVTSPFHCDYGVNIELGEKVFFNFNCIVLDVCSVSIGSFTLLGPAVHIYTPMHPFDARKRRLHEYGKPVVIGSDVWIGGGALVLPGVSIGDRTVIGAGSVVTRDVPADVFAAGNPCRIIRPIV